MDKELDTLVAEHKAEVHPAPEHVVNQWHSAIDEAAALERGRNPEHPQGWHPTSFFWGVAVTAALAIGIGIGFLVSSNSTSSNNGDGLAQPPAIAASTTTDRPLVPVAFTRGLAVHLRDSREQLASLGEQADSTALILQIIQQNRMFESAADLNNAPKLARVLRAFEPILLQLAANDIAPEDAEALRAQLAFELNVMLTKLASESSDELRIPDVKPDATPDTRIQT
ncbi:MAG: hypothetical protein ACR2QZ_16845 [Woeseiaceae bacterium]